MASLCTCHHYARVLALHMCQCVVIVALVVGVCQPLRRYLFNGRRWAHVRALVGGRLNALVIGRVQRVFDGHVSTRSSLGVLTRHYIGVHMPSL